MNEEYVYGQNMTKTVNAATLLGCPDLYVIDQMCKIGVDGEGVVVVGGLEEGDAERFEARKLAIRHAESKMGYTKAGYNGMPVQRIPGRVKHKVAEKDGTERVVELYCCRHGVAVT